MTENATKIYVIAEVASTHQGQLDYMLRLIAAAARTGADAVKFQIYRAEEIMEKDHPDFACIHSYELDEAAWAKCIRAAKDSGLDVWVDLSCEYGSKVIEANREAIRGVKLHSAEISNNLKIIEYLASSKLSVILSCGGTTLIELIDVLDKLRDKERLVILMHGFQSYPTAAADTNLRRIRTLTEMFGLPVGIADHIDGGDTFAKYMPVLAVGAGAKVVEKHITLDRKEKRDDYFSSLDPADYTEMVSMLRESESALGEGGLIFPDKEKAYRLAMKKKVKTAGDVNAGEKLDVSRIVSIQTGSKTEPPSALQIIRTPLAKKMKAGETVNHSDLKHNLGIFLNARLHSTRLPRKALLPFYEGLTTIEYLMKRLKSYPGSLGKIVFATSTEAEDDPLIACAKRMDIEAFRGDPLDVMRRMLQVAEHYKFDTIVRVTGDDILVSAEYIEKAVRHHYENNLEYTRIAGLAYGAESEIIDIHALSIIHRGVVQKKKTEYLTWFLDRDGICKTAVMQAEEKDRRPGQRLTLDYEEDYFLMKDLAEKCHKKIKEFYLPLDMINQYLDHSKLSVPHVERYQKLKREDIDTSLKYSFPGVRT